MFRIQIIGLISALFVSIHLSVVNADLEEVLIQTEVIAQESFSIIYIYYHPDNWITSCTFSLSGKQATLMKSEIKFSYI